MSEKFVLTTDSGCDLPRQYYKDHSIDVIDMSYVLNEKTYKDGDESMPPQVFYQKIREHAMPSTTQINPEEFTEFFEKHLVDGSNVLHLSFSSGLSGSYNSAVIAAGELNEKYGAEKVIVVDTLCASMGEGLLLDLVNAKKNEGVGFHELAEWAEDHKLKICHCVTVDNLFHLLRGGRVSKASAIVGSVLGIKPIIHVDPMGKLVPIDKIRGRNAAIDTLLQMMIKRTDGKYNGRVFISHGDCIDDANYLAQKIKDQFGVQEIMIHFIGPVIGAHSGPGTLALFFEGKNR